MTRNIITSFLRPTFDGCKGQRKCSERCWKHRAANVEESNIDIRDSARTTAWHRSSPNQAEMNSSDVSRLPLCRKLLSTPRLPTTTLAFLDVRSQFLHNHLQALTGPAEAKEPVGDDFDDSDTDAMD